MMRRIMTPQSIVPTAVSIARLGARIRFHGAPDWYLLDQSSWLQVGEDGFVPAFPTHQRIVVPFSLWELRRDDLDLHSGPLGLELRPLDDLSAVVPDLACFDLIALHVGPPGEDRSNAIARQLRNRYSYQGKIVALRAHQSPRDVDGLRNAFDAHVILGDTYTTESPGAPGIDPQFPVQVTPPSARRRTQAAIP